MAGDIGVMLPHGNQAKNIAMVNTNIVNKLGLPTLSAKDLSNKPHTWLILAIDSVHLPSLLNKQTTYLGSV